MTAIEMLWVDAFTERPFSGNQAAVCLLDEQAREDWMQALASEINLSETAFVWPPDDDQHPGGPCFGLRWFTPLVEVPLCGHATLAAAHALWEQRRVDQDNQIRFNTISGPLIAKRRAADQRIELDFPLLRARPADYDTSPLFAGRPRFVGVALDHGHGDPTRLIELENAEAVRILAPNLDAVRHPGAAPILVTARSDDDRYDFVSRFFAPSAGVDEDPVTGSAHCLLASYWSERLGRHRLRGYQASRRGGFVDVEVLGERVLLGGVAVTVARGALSAAVGQARS